MIINEKNQNDILEIFDLNYEYHNKPINRLGEKEINSSKSQKLLDLKKKIQDIQNCELKQNANNLVFSDGNINSQIMFVGEGPGQKEDEQCKPFVGDAGNLLNKMLISINIERVNIYVTNVVNYRPPKNRKPDSSEIVRYSNFLKEHISIIDPKILVLMGSTAMESILGPKIKISKERGKWRNVLINNKSIKTIVTFHPAYLLRQPEQKKFSWEDLKMIRKEFDYSKY